MYQIFWSGIWAKWFLLAALVQVVGMMTSLINLSQKRILRTIIPLSVGLCLGLCIFCICFLILFPDGPLSEWKNTIITFDKVGDINGSYLQPPWKSLMFGDLAFSPRKASLIVYCLPLRIITFPYWHLGSQNVDFVSKVELQDKTARFIATQLSLLEGGTIPLNLLSFTNSHNFTQW